MLLAADDPRAGGLLDDAHRRLVACADSIADPAMRSSYLGAEHHRRLIAAASGDVST